jgi:hypothetical protein
MVSGESGQLRFTYDLSKDAWNIIHAAQSKNHPTLTEVEQAYVDRYGAEFKQAQLEEFVVAYARERELNVDALVGERERVWRPIEQAFLKRMEQLFKVTLPELPRVYLTIDKRCAYSFRDNFFFVSMFGKFPQLTVAHELVHFYTWHSFGKSPLAQGLPSAAFNDLKESLTELLNVACSDILGDVRDLGYPQHTALRASIRDAFEKSGDVRRVVLDMLPTMDSSRVYQLPELI